MLRKLRKQLSKVYSTEEALKKAARPVLMTLMQVFCKGTKITDDGNIIPPGGASGMAYGSASAASSDHHPVSEQVYRSYSSNSHVTTVSGNDANPTFMISDGHLLGAHLAFLFGVEFKIQVFGEFPVHSV
jgi:hypothetical protein